MFNLMIAGADNAWEEGVFVWPVSRLLEYTDEATKEQFDGLTPDQLTRLAALPTLFAYESNTDGTPRVGTIRHLQRRGSEVRIVTEFDERAPELTAADIQRIGPQMWLGEWELNRTHWAVKQGDLHQILRDAGLWTDSALGQEQGDLAIDEPATVKVATSRIFLVHGRDEGLMQRVARFLETKVGLDVCVLQERPNRGRTILTKFHEEAQGANYAVVLMTADDLGRLAPAFDPAARDAPRARQNVVFELGFFLGRLGLDRVCVLLADGVERPSDYEGVVYVQLDQHDGWQRRLVAELLAAEVPVAPDWWHP